MHLKTKLFSVLALSATALCMSCDKQDAPDSKDDQATGWEAYIPFSSDYTPQMLTHTASYSDDDIVMIGRQPLEEVSGIVSSRKNPGMFWVHEDSGNSNRMYLLDDHAQVVATYVIVGAVNLDWEDMEIAEDKSTGKVHLYISETGDNNQRRASYAIYRLVEPTYSGTPSSSPIEYTIADSELEKYTFTYPDKSHDTEAMWVDPQTMDIYLATKRDPVSMLFVLPYPQQSGAAISSAIYAGSFGFREASAGTANVDGSRVIIRNRQQFFYWERQPGERMIEMLARRPLLTAAAGETQGEAVCFDIDNNYYSTSEKGNSSMDQPVFKYPARK